LRTLFSDTKHNGIEEISKTLELHYSEGKKIGASKGKLIKHKKGEQSE